MTVYGTLVTAQPSGPGWWSECTLASAFAVTGTTTSAVMSIVYYNTGNREFQPSLPIGCIVPSLTTATNAAGSTYATLQNSTNNILSVQSTNTGGIGLASCILGNGAVQTNTTTGLVSYTETGTISLTWVNAGATSTLTAGTRLLFIQSQGN